MTPDVPSTAGPLDRVVVWLDHFIPGSVRDEPDSDALRRARLLVAGSVALGIVNLLFTPLVLLFEGFGLNVLLLVGGASSLFASPLLLRQTGSMMVATCVACLSMSMVLWVGATHSGGYESATLHFVAAIPLMATFLVNARLGFAFAIAMAISVEAFYFADVGGFPFVEVPDPEGERLISAQVSVVEIAFVTLLAWLFEGTRTRTLELVRQSETQYALMADNSPGVPFQVVVPAGGKPELVFVSSSLKRLLDLEPDDVTADASLLLGLLREADREALLRAFAEGAANGKIVDWAGAMAMPDETEKHWRVTARPHLVDGQMVFDGFANDVTEQWMLQQELAAAMTRTKAILENMPAGLVAFGEDGTVNRVNPALQQMFGVAGTPDAEALPAALRDIAQTALRTGEATTRQLMLPNSRVGTAVATPIDGDGSPSRGVLVMVRDTTHEHEVDRMKTNFIASVSHELRTPLTSILGFTKLNRNKLERVVYPSVDTSNAKVERAIALIRTNFGVVLDEGDRLSALINDVLDISKMEAGRMDWNMAEFDAATLVSRCIAATRPLFTDGVVHIASEVTPDLQPCVGDFNRLLQVLINLVSNAARHTEAGAVVVSVEPTPEGLCFSVTDVGEGIAPEHHEAVFAKFRQVGDALTSRPTGTGLGLPISKQIVEAHEGRIWVESEVGQGARFAFVIPMGTTQA